MSELFTFERRDLLRWLLAVVCGSWLLGATLHVINSSRTDVPLDGANFYMPYERQLAACNELRTSQAKYDCTSKLMLGRDRSLFAKILIVLMPPIALVGAVGFIAFARRVRRDREHQRAAHEAYQAQMAAYREKSPRKKLRSHPVCARKRCSSTTTATSSPRRLICRAGAKRRLKSSRLFYLRITSYPKIVSALTPYAYVFCIITSAA